MSLSFDIINFFCFSPDHTTPIETTKQTTQSQDFSWPWNGFFGRLPTPFGPNGNQLRTSRERLRTKFSVNQTNHSDRSI